LENGTGLDRDHDVFSTKRRGDNLVFKFKQSLLFGTTDLGAMFAILNYLSLVFRKMILSKCLFFLVHRVI
jgi:hypothetical protein